MLIQQCAEHIPLDGPLAVNNQVKTDTPTTVAPANLPEPPMMPPVISAPPPYLPSVASNPTGTDDCDSGNNNISPSSLSHNIQTPAILSA